DAGPDLYDPPGRMGEGEASPWNPTVTAVQPARAGLSSEPGGLPGSRRARGPTPRPGRGTPPRPRAREHAPFPPPVDRRAPPRAHALARSPSRSDAPPPDGASPAPNGGRARTPPVAA